MSVCRITPRAPGVAAMLTRLDVFVVGADIADVGKREGDDLPGIGRVGEDLLIARHGGVEADLADRVAGRAEAKALEHRAVGQHQKRRRLWAQPKAGKVPVEALAASSWPLSCVS